MEKYTVYDNRKGTATIRTRFKIGDPVYYVSAYDGELEIKEGQVLNMEIRYKADWGNGNGIRERLITRYGFGDEGAMDRFCYSSKREVAEALKAFAEKILRDDK